MLEQPSSADVEETPSADATSDVASNTEYDPSNVAIALGAG